MTELSLAETAIEVALFEPEAPLIGGGQISLGAALSSHASADGFRKCGASGAIRNFRLRNVVLDGDDLTLFQRGMLIRDTCYFLPDSQETKRAARAEAVTDLGDERVYIIACNLRQHHYGHWMMQCLPTIDRSLRHRSSEEVCLVMRDIEPW